MPRFLNAITYPDRIDFIHRTDDGRLMIKRAPAEYVSFHRMREVKPHVQELKRTRAVTGMAEDGEWLRLRWASYDARKHACSLDGPLANSGVKSYEADVGPVRRWMVDNHAEIAHPRFAYLDIETDSRVPFADKEHARILCWTLIDALDEAVVFHGQLHEDSDDDERRMLNELWTATERYDMLAAWMSPFKGEFDFEMIHARTKAVGASDKHVRRLLYLDHLKAFKRMNSTSAESGEEKRSYKLDAIAQALRVGQKDKFDASKTWHAWVTHPCSGDPPCMACRACLFRYNKQDTALMKRIEDKTGFIALFQTLCDVCRIFPESHSLHPTVQMDGFMLQLGRERNHHFPTKYYEDQEGQNQGQYEGAFVVEPRKGIVRNVHVGDFKSMYPNNIITWNMSPDTKVSSAPPNGPIPDGHCRCPSTGVVFRTQPQGILPAAVSEMLRLRQWWNEERTRRVPNTPEWKDADRRATAYKVAANSFYGVVGSPFSRYYDRQVAESITQNGVWLIKKTIEQVTARGWTTEYGDTDAAYVKGPSKKEFEEFTEWLNRDYYPRIIGATGAKSHCQMAYEKEFELVVFCGKKRYVGRILHYKGKFATDDSEPTIAGLEYKRGDTSRMAAAMQKECIDLLCKRLVIDAAAYEPILNRYLNHVLHEPLTLDEVVISKSLSNNLSDYVQKIKTDGEPAAQAPHIMLAHELLKRGAINTRRIHGKVDVPAGTRIEYVVTDARVTPTQVVWAKEYTGECDRFYYWEKMVWPATRRLLEAAFPEHDWTKYDKVRPRRVRSAARVAEGQGAFNFDGAPAPQTGLRNVVLPFEVPRNAVVVHTPQGNGAPAVAPMRRTRSQLASMPIVVVMDTAEHANPNDAMERVYEALRAHPGKRPVEMHVMTGGSLVVLSLPFTAAGTPELAAALRGITGHGNGTPTQA